MFVSSNNIVRTVSRPSSNPQTPNPVCSPRRRPHSRAQCSLYAGFTSHTFTSCTAQGPTGPTQSQCQNAYSGASWVSNAAYFSVSGGFQIWTVPATGTYTIKAVGAVPPKQTYDPNYQYIGGKPAIMEATFSLTQGTKLRLLVGQAPVQSQFNGGGGGTFVAVDGATTPLVVAGGGGSYRTGFVVSADPGYAHLDANLGTAGKSCQKPDGSYYGSCTNDGGINGGGATGSAAGGGGAGFSGDATPESTGTRTNAKSFLNGGMGGVYATSGSQDGGFGGGGHGGWGGAGGGGGYSGGSGANNNPFPPGGGGGSYIDASRAAVITQTLMSPHSPGHGYITITSGSSTPAAAPARQTYNPQ